MSATTRQLAVRPVGQRLQVGAGRPWPWRMSIDQLRNPLDQMLITFELACGAILTVIGGWVLAFRGLRWGLFELIAGVAILVIAIVAVILARRA